MFNPNAPLQQQPGQFDFEARQAAIEQRKRLLAQLMRQQEQAQATPGPQGKMVGGHYVKPHALEHLAHAAKPLMAQWGANREQRALEDDTAAYANADRQAAQAHVASRPQARPGYGANEMDNDAVPPTQPSTREMLQWAQRGASIPSRKDVLSKVMADLEVNEPIRQEARADRQQDREDRQADRRATIAAQMDLRREQSDKDENFRRDKLASDREQAAQRQADAQAMRELVKLGQISAAELRREQIRAAAEGKSAAESATHAKERQGISEQARNAQERMELLNDAMKAGKTATGSGIGSVADKAASIVGWSTEGAKGAAKLKSLQAQLLTLTPKLGGATSDADVRNYREAVGQIGDETLPMATRQAAMDTVQAINQRDYDNALNRGREFTERSQGKPGSGTRPANRLKFNPATGQVE